jgi:hypothetical protein
MKHNGVIITLAEHELKAIHEALFFKSQSIKRACGSNAETLFDTLAKIFENAEGASITIAYKI